MNNYKIENSLNEALNNPICKEQIMESLSEIAIIGNSDFWKLQFDTIARTVIASGYAEHLEQIGAMYAMVNAVGDILKSVNETNNG